MRYLPLNRSDREHMLAKIGVGHINDLFRDVPDGALLADHVDLPSHMSEMAVDRDFRTMAEKNLPAGGSAFFCGGGAYRHYVPSTVDYMLQRGEFLTAYTPYQPEISQGTLQALFEFQTQVAQITGMEVANASMYDGSTACGEAVLMARRASRKKRAILSGSLHPQYIEVVKCATRFTDDVTVVNPVDCYLVDDLIDQIDDETSCVVVQNPDFFGNLQDFSRLAEALHTRKALLIVVVTEVVSLGAIRCPGAMGADIVVGEGQSIGNGLTFGGPYVGLLATRQKFVRTMPGRVCGETVDADGRRGFVLTLSTREQHIRREKATSNICTNAGLCTLAFTIHMTLLGEKGFRHLARLNHRKAVQLADKIAAIDGVELLNDSFFNEFTVRLPMDAAEAVEHLAGMKILAGIPLSRLYPDNPDMKNKLLVAVTETVTDDDMDRLVSQLKELVK
ncbi:Glycine dehydrogenase [decarboxylating] (glycine cleavage system P1 protein) [hydrothermal vent metagenome]|uniref:glycine dehydrogenase (aminomethyl-transferring) n=1 Tax=hydrothermal vent metagenome TaxID=652676 RepID=A0A3B0RRS3_9ZZZZ